MSDSLTEPAVPAPPAEAPEPRRSRGALIATATVGALALGGVAWGGTAAYRWYTGADSSVRAEQVLPADTSALVTFDTDPAGSQKVDAVRFLLKFPGSAKATDGVTETSDWRRKLFESLQQDGTLVQGADWTRDVAPWLGRRFSVAVVGAEQTSVLLVPVLDAEAATAGLAKVVDPAAATCTVREDYAYCVEKSSAAALGTLTASLDQGTLADRPEFRGDLAEVPADSIVTFWGDLATLQVAQPTSLASSASGVTRGALSSGRVAGGVRFDGPNLQLKGRLLDAQTEWAALPPTPGTVTDLPADTQIALGVRGLDSQLTTTWPTLEKALSPLFGLATGGSGGGAEDVETATGLSLPGDLAKALGSDTVIAARFADSSPTIALRSNGSPLELRRIVDVIEGFATASKLGSESSSGSGAGSSAGDPLLFTSEADGRTLVATDRAYGSAVGSGKGLGATAGFTAAVADPAARVVFYLAPTALVDLLPGTDPADVAALSGLGLSITGEGRNSTVELRLATR